VAAKDSVDDRAVSILEIQACRCSFDIGQREAEFIDFDPRSLLDHFRKSRQPALDPPVRTWEMTPHISTPGDPLLTEIHPDRSGGHPRIAKSTASSLTARNGLRQRLRLQAVSRAGEEVPAPPAGEEFRGSPGDSTGMEREVQAGLAEGARELQSVDPDRSRPRPFRVPGRCRAHAEMLHQPCASPPPPSSPPGTSCPCW